MNPTYKIFGEERRKIKKELNKLKSQVKSFWYWYDLDEVYGSVRFDKTEANRLLDEMKQEIQRIEKSLATKNRECKLERILK